MREKLEIKFKNGSAIRWLESNGYTLRPYQYKLLHMLSGEEGKEDSSMERDNKKEDRTF